MPVNRLFDAGISMLQNSDRNRSVVTSHAKSKQKGGTDPGFSSIQFKYMNNIQSMDLRCALPYHPGAQSHMMLLIV